MRALKPGAQSPRLRRNGLTCRPGLKVGLLGGSFNPAHAGHMHISRLALQRLGLDQIWWLVSPQNPLKSTAGMLSMQQRIKSAKRVANGTAIQVTAIEASFRTSNTVDTIRNLNSLFPKTKFVWLMGADNLGQMSRWRHWQTLMGNVPIAIFGRPTYSLRALNSLAARHIRRQRVRAQRFRGLALRKPPVWCFISGPLHPQSATAIRQAGNQGAHLNQTNDKRSNSS